MEIIINQDAAGAIIISVFLICTTIWFIARWYFEYKYEKAKLEHEKQ